jgi:hypothetical protein
MKSGTVPTGGWQGFDFAEMACAVSTATEY